MLHRGTPLYGQPAWWGDGDADDQQHGRPEEKGSDKKREKVETGHFFFPHSAAHISDLRGLTLHLRAVMKVDLISIKKKSPLLHSLDFVVLKSMRPFIDRHQERRRGPKVRPSNSV